MKDAQDFSSSLTIMNVKAIDYSVKWHVMVALAMGIFLSPNNSAIMGSAPRERLGVVSRLLSLTRTIGQTTGVAVLGSAWASRVFAYAGTAVPGGATTASEAIQVSALRDTYSGILVLMSFGLALGIWMLIDERRR